MSILVTTLFPLVLSGATPPPDLSAIRAVPPAAQVSVIAPAAKPATAIPVVVTAPRAPVAAPVIAAPPAQLVRINAPEPAPEPAPAPAPQTETTLSAAERNAIVTRVGKALSDTKSAAGKFTQTDAYGDNSSGNFYIQRPGKVRFEYTSPEPMFIVSDGVTVSIEEPKRQSYDAAPLASTPMHLFLRSNVDLQKDGSVVDVAARNGSTFVTLEDRSGEAEGKMILEFRASDFELMGWRTVDGSGAETRVRLTDTKVNVPLKASMFIVEDPADREDIRR
jgi:outer membrane lipoprotein-sorting protein